LPRSYLWERIAKKDKNVCGREQPEDFFVCPDAIAVFSSQLKYKETATPSTRKPVILDTDSDFLLGGYREYRAFSILSLMELDASSIAGMG